MIRTEVVDALVASLAEQPGEYAQIYTQATEEERDAAARLLARAARSPALPLLALSWRQAVDLGRQMFLAGNAVLWLANELAHEWPGDGTRTLGDVLKTMAPERLDHLRDELKIAGIVLDDADAPPSP